MIRVWRIPFSTNVERVALALGHKGLAAEWVDVDRNDRTTVIEASGQPLVPVLEDDGKLIADSTAIFEYLEERYPDPPLYPRDEARRAEAVLLIDWFNRVWKRPRNEHVVMDSTLRQACAARCYLQSTRRGCGLL